MQEKIKQLVEDAVKCAKDQGVKDFDTFIVGYFLGYAGLDTDWYNEQKQTIKEDKTDEQK